MCAHQIGKWFHIFRWVPHYQAIRWLTLCTRCVPNRPPAVPGRDRVGRSGSRDFFAQISHTQPSRSMVRVLIAPPISRRTAEISRGGPKYPRIGAFLPVRLGLWIHSRTPPRRTLWPFCLYTPKSLFPGNGDRLDLRLVRGWAYLIGARIVRRGFPPSSHRPRPARPPLQ